MNVLKVAMAVTKTQSVSIPLGATAVPADQGLKELEQFAKASIWLKHLLCCSWSRILVSDVCVHICVYFVCVCVAMKKSAGQMASTTSDTGDTSSKQQQAQRKENYNKIKRPVSSVDHCHPYRRKKRREAVY